jgi:nucleotide-binding universal stress UspA family protein
MEPSDYRPRRIVVGVDSSTQAAAALEWACRLAGPDDRIVAVRAWHAELTWTAQFIAAVLPDDYERSAERVLDAIVDAAGDPRIERLSCRGLPGPVVVDAAAGADLVVVGHRGDGRISLMLGSTANYVLRHSRQPVVVARGDMPRSGHPVARRVLVGVDDHDLVNGPPDRPAVERAVNESVRALQWAYKLPSVERIRVLHAWEPPTLGLGVGSTLELDLSAIDAAALSLIDRVIDAAGHAPASIAVETDVARGSAGGALVDGSRDADLVVVGSRGRGSLRGLMLGSTSAEVAAHSHCPVAVIR